MYKQTGTVLFLHLHSSGVSEVLEMAFLSMLAQLLTVSLLELRVSVKVFDLEAVICIQHTSDLFLRGLCLFL